MSTFEKDIEKKRLYKEYLNVMNGILQLSTRELEILAVLLQIDEEYKPAFEAYKNILSTDNRRVMMREGGVNKNNLSKYINTFKEKAVISMNENKGWEIRKTFKPVISDILDKEGKPTGKKGVEVKFILNIK